ncbi:DUF4817 domain-containing protein [Caerostris darwini]|uniref:DUF4817 domain-containing protein n=1 Tax=Caerostris darwini TaxID=1538125 RepID=A0AAV4PQ95_9ARAC|nr:DUF4817 domain-containing protein [Caerostris darwini]
MNMSSSTVHRLLRAEGLYPYRYRTVQGLHPGDFYLCTDFCEWLLQQHETDNAFIARILWTDERHQDHRSVNVWVGLIGNRLIGPYLLPERLTGHSYLIFLRDVLIDVLDDMPLATIRGLWFQHIYDTFQLSTPAPTHFSSLVYY